MATRLTPHRGAHSLMEGGECGRSVRLEAQTKRTAVALGQNREMERKINAIPVFIIAGRLQENAAPTMTRHR